ncbi:MAG: hypothetical protein IPH16_16240 [Haliscomenobacter sp.]|nr:hypothetical protein [Haliscomenobacter sp.]
MCLIHPLEAPLPMRFTEPPENEPFQAEASTQNNALARRLPSGRSLLPSGPEEDSLFQVQDPYLNALICLSNTSLLQMGQYLRIEVPELMELQELTVFSANESCGMPNTAFTWPLTWFPAFRSFPGLCLAGCP